jgi:hypothetical protein
MSIHALDILHAKVRVKFLMEYMHTYICISRELDRCATLTRVLVVGCLRFFPIGKHETCVVTAGNVPKCGCKTGYVKHEMYGCVDESPPILRLKNDPLGDQTLRLKQGDWYKEYAVEVQDENAEEYLRSLKIAYSQPLPNGCLTSIGEFHVNYTVATPWTSPPYIRVTRRVIIEDVDECTLDVALYEKTCPALIPQCDVAAGATCVNTIGSYSCQCPKFTSGDGFKTGLTFDPMNVPQGFSGGTGCRDTTKPVIQLQGPNPKIFRVCACGGIAGVMGKPAGGTIKDAELQRSQQKQYSDNVKVRVCVCVGFCCCTLFAIDVGLLPCTSLFCLMHKPLYQLHF